MSNRARLKFSGLAELPSAIGNYGRSVVADARTAIAEAVEETVRGARAEVEVDSGETRSKITGEVKIDPYGAVGIVHSRGRASTFLEHGTERMAARPFFISEAIANRRRLNKAHAESIQRRAPQGLGRPTVSGEGPRVPVVGGDE